jgi:hypothetical protein
MEFQVGDGCGADKFKLGDRIAPDNQRGFEAMWEAAHDAMNIRLCVSRLQIDGPSLRIDGSVRRGRLRPSRQDHAATPKTAVDCGTEATGQRAVGQVPVYFRSRRALQRANGCSSARDSVIGRLGVFAAVFRLCTGIEMRGGQRRRSGGGPRYGDPEPGTDLHMAVGGDSVEYADFYGGKKHGRGTAKRWLVDYKHPGFTRLWTVRRQD